MNNLLIFACATAGFNRENEDLQQSDSDLEQPFVSDLNSD